MSELVPGKFNWSWPSKPSTAIEVEPRPSAPANIIRHPLNLSVTGPCDHVFRITEELSPTLVVAECRKCGLEEEQNRMAVG